MSSENQRSGLLINILQQKQLQSISYKMIESVELSKQDRMKQMKQKLDSMMKKKNLVSEQIVKQVKNTNLPKINQDQQEETQKATKPQQKTKKIKKQPKKKEVNVTFRKAAGEVWKDKTLQEWPLNDFRIFCGNLGNQVSDEILSNAFKRYPSFNMARVVQDRRTGKSRGYGFVSFGQPKDFLNALKQMNGFYIGNRPVKLTKSNWKDRSLQSQKGSILPLDFKSNSKKQTNKICIDYKYTSPY